MTSHEKLQKGEAAIYGRRVEGPIIHMDAAEREKSRRFLESVIEQYESGNPAKKSGTKEAQD